MKTTAIAAAAILATLATGASAQTYDRPSYDRPSYDRPSGDTECFNPRAGHSSACGRASRRTISISGRCRAVETRDQECFNPRTGGFERVRPGETQNDLDFRRCHFVGYAMPESYPAPEVRERRELRQRRQECWNPRARHYEEVRPGEEQNDLDFDRCRLGSLIVCDSRGIA